MIAESKKIENGYYDNSKENSKKFKKLMLIGTPNVGKSVIFGNFTGQYVTISNYPGTTVEVTRGKSKINGKEFEVIDTPGMYSLFTITEEEHVAKSIIFKEIPEIAIQIADAKNLERMLQMTLQLIEADLPVILNLNLMDEAQKSGIKINLDILEKNLNIPVTATVATNGSGIDILKNKIFNYTKKPGYVIKYDDILETAINNIENLLINNYTISKRAVALLLLQEDPDIAALIEGNPEKNYISIEKIIEDTQKRYDQPLNYIITIARQQNINSIIKESVEYTVIEKSNVLEKASQLMMNPITGIPILLLVIYLFYVFVGVFGAQISVDFLEKNIFEKHITPVITGIVTSIIPWKTGQELFVYDYGIITLGLRYAVALILPIVTTFFIAFSIIEDTGYLPRLAMLIDRVFKRIGLNGRAVIPMVLGFGCDSMATIVTRTLETKREKIIATFLLSLAIPCSAQIGVIFALLAGKPTALGLFIGIMTFIFLLVGYLTAKILPGEKPLFYMEVPPLRMPKFSNVFIKTYTRVEWYFKEILPLFILASIFIWIGRITGLFNFMVNILSYPISWIGLPKQAATAFLFGFFRRDFGAAGLYDLKDSGLLTGHSLVVATVTMALFMPCIAQFSIAMKERGWKAAFGMTAFIFPFSFFVGFLVDKILNLLGVII